MVLCLPIFLGHSHNGPFEMLMFIWCFEHFVFIAWVIDLAIINLAWGFYFPLDNDNKSRQRAVI